MKKTIDKRKQTRKKQKIAIKTKIQLIKSMIRQFVYTVYKYLSVYVYDAYYICKGILHTYIDEHQHTSTQRQTHIHRCVYVNIEVFYSNRETNELTMHE